MAHAGPRLLLMHHFPFPWGAALSFHHLPWPLPQLAARLGGGGGVAGLVSVNFADVAAVQAFVEAAPLDAVCCGHLHTPGARERWLGRVPVFCMGRSGAMHSRSYAYHLLEWDGALRRVQARTVQLSGAELDELARRPTEPRRPDTRPAASPRGARARR